MEAAILPFTPVADGQTLAWLRVAVRSLRSLSPDERKLRRKVLAAAETVGEPLLADDVETRAQLDQRIDEMVVAVDLDDLWRWALPRLPRMLKDAAVDPEATEFDPVVDKVLGPSSRLVLAQGALFARHAASALLTLMQSLEPLDEDGKPTREPEAILLASLEGVPPVIEIVRDDKIPLRARETALDGLRANVAMLGIIRAIDKKQRIEPWLALALSERFTRGQKQLLRLYAGLPHAQVPESVLPRSEWILEADLEAEQAEWESHVTGLARADDGPPDDV